MIKLARKNEIQVAQKITTEVTTYFVENNIPGSNNIINWWQKYCKRFLILSDIAQQNMAKPTIQQLPIDCSSRLVIIDRAIYKDFVLVYYLVSFARGLLTVRKSNIFSPRIFNSY